MFSLSLHLFSLPNLCKKHNCSVPTLVSFHSTEQRLENAYLMIWTAQRFKNLPWLSITPKLKEKFNTLTTIHETEFSGPSINLQLIICPPTPHLSASARCWSFFVIPPTESAHARLFAWNILLFTLNLIKHLSVPGSGIPSSGQVDEEWGGSKCRSLGGKASHDPGE